MNMKKLTGLFSGVLAVVLLSPVAFSLATSVANGSVSDLGLNEVLTEFGLLTGTIKFKLGSLIWPPSEIWLIPSQVDPDIFSKGLTQKTVLEIPSNATWSTCRTAVYENTTVGTGFKIYNTGTTTQILQNGTFCGLAYNGTYFVYGKY